MYMDSPKFDKPGPNGIVWRYMNMMKFRWLMENGALYCRKINRLQDEFEGTIFESEFRKILDNIGAHPYVRSLGLSSEELRPRVENNGDILRDFVFVNCWNENEYESTLMWDRYTDETGGVAIRTNFDSLCKSLNVQKEYNANIGRIRYADPYGDSFEDDSRYNHCLMKRIDFACEKEVRVISMGKYIQDFKTTTGETSFTPDFISLPVDLTTLIGEIYIAPFADVDVIDEARSIAAQHGMEDCVVESSL